MRRVFAPAALRNKALSPESPFSYRFTYLLSLSLFVFLGQCSVPTGRGLHLKLCIPFMLAQNVKNITVITGS